MKHINLSRFKKSENPSAQLVYTFLKENETEIYTDDGGFEYIIDFLQGYINDERNKEFFQFFELSSIVCSGIPETLTYWNLEFDLKNLSDQEKHDIASIINKSTWVMDDDNQPYPSKSYYYGTLFLTIIGLE